MRRISFAVMAIAAIAFSGCSKGSGEDNPIKLSSSAQTMRYDDEFQIQATSDTPITYTSENDYHAEVSSSGLVTAGRIGETNIVMTNGDDTKKLKITVRPESNLYAEPDLTFGMTRSAVKAKLGSPDSETEDGIGYEDWSYASEMLICLFDEDDKLTSYSVAVKTLYAEELVAFLAERYVLGSVPDNGDLLAIFINSLDLNTANMTVSVFYSDLSYLMTMYMPVPVNIRSTISRSDVKKSIEELMEGLMNK